MATLASRTENRASALARRMSQAAIEVDAAADAVAVDGGDDRHRAVGHRGDRGLEAQDLRPGPAAARAAIDGRAPSPAAGGPASPDMAIRSSPTEKWGPLAATTTARTSGSAPRAAMATRQVGPEGRAHGVALLGAVEPQGGHVAVDLEGEDVGAERVDGGGRRHGRPA